MPSKVPISQSNGSGMFPCSGMPEIPEAPLELQQLLEHLKAQDIGERKIRAPKKSNNKLNTKKPKTKLNGFMAYRTFFSQDIYSIKDQREVSSCLGRCWATDKSQLIWKRYATEYNVRPSQFSNMPFLEWLLKSTGNETKQEKEKKEWTKHLKSGSRIQDIYFNEDGEILKSEQMANLFDDTHRTCDNLITDLDFDAAIANGKTGYPIDPIIESIQNSKHTDSNSTKTIYYRNR